MPEFDTGEVQPNGLRFHYLEAGDEPLALCLHGTQDGYHGLNAEQVQEVPTHCGEGSESELIEGVGHFMMVEKPEEINGRILQFLGKA
jgi:pimeloyl-ACP methyl ester carboxylesterase